MDILKINETPVRTSRNFNINNIKLENVDIPKNIDNFDKKFSTVVYVHFIAHKQ